MATFPRVELVLTFISIDHTLAQINDSLLTVPIKKNEHHEFNKRGLNKAKTQKLRSIHSANNRYNREYAKKIWSHRKMLK